MYGRLKLTITHTHTHAYPHGKGNSKKTILNAIIRGSYFLGTQTTSCRSGLRPFTAGIETGTYRESVRCTKSGNEFSFDARYLDAIETAVFLSLHHSPCSTQHGQHGSPLQVRITVTAGVRPPKPGIFISPFLLSSLQHTSEPVGKRMLLGA